MTTKITNFSALHSALKNYTLPSYWLFRGHSDITWDLIPKCSRSPYNKRNDRDMFNLWKQKAFEYTDNPPNEDWHWLALAQHHGLATRLLDWSDKPLVAAFFACNENLNKDGVIYCYLCGKYISPQAFHETDPWSATETNIFRPHYKNRRIHNQFGDFTISGNPNKCLSEQILANDKIEKIIIDKDYKKELILELNHYGINWGTLYPDLDGHSKLCNWFVEYGEKNLSSHKPRK